MTEATAVRADVRLAREAFGLELQFAAPARGITGILGPSGSGKTTLLRCIAGLEPDCRGTVAVNGAVWQDSARFVPVHGRAVGFVFQDARLFPHLTVRRTLDYGMRRSESRFASGSSIRITLGARSSARPSATRCASPADRPAGLRASSGARPSNSTASSKSTLPPELRRMP